MKQIERRLRYNSLSAILLTLLTVSGVGSAQAKQDEFCSVSHNGEEHWPADEKQLHLSSNPNLLSAQADQEELGPSTGKSSASSRADQRQFSLSTSKTAMSAQASFAVPAWLLYWANGDYYRMLMDKRAIAQYLQALDLLRDPKDAVYRCGLKGVLDPRISLNFALADAYVTSDQELVAPASKDAYRLRQQYLDGGLNPDSYGSARVIGTFTGDFCLAVVRSEVDAATPKACTYEIKVEPDDVKLNVKGLGLPDIEGGAEQNPSSMIFEVGGGSSPPIVLSAKVPSMTVPRWTGCKFTEVINVPGADVPIVNIQFLHVPCTFAPALIRGDRIFYFKKATDPVLIRGPWANAVWQDRISRFL